MYLAYLIAAIFLLVYFGLQKFVKSGVTENDLRSRSSKNGGIPVKVFVITGIALLIIRMIMGYYLKAYPSDMSCWKAWGAKVLSVGPGHFYAPDYFCDYPPGYVTILGFFSWIKDLFGLGDKGTELCFKLPGIFADAGMTAMIFWIGSKHMSRKSALVLGIIYMLNPLIITNSAAWGQVESVLALFLVLAMYNLYKKNYYLSGIFYVIAVLVKPQALMVGPVFLFAFVASKDIKMILKMIVIGFVMIMTFSIAYNYDAWAGGAGFLTALNPMWLIKKYMSTLGSYEYFTINAFNFYAMLKLNWVAFDSVALSSTMLNIISYGLIFAAVGGALYLFIKIKSPSGKIFIPSFFIIAFLFTFGLKMHERYMITPIIFLIFEFILSKNKRTLHCFALFSAVNFLNVFCILRYILMYNTTGPDYSAIVAASIIEVITFIVTMFILINDYLIYPKASMRYASDVVSSKDHGLAYILNRISKNSNGSSSSTSSNNSKSHNNKNKGKNKNAAGNKTVSGNNSGEEVIYEIPAEYRIAKPVPLDVFWDKLKAWYFGLGAKLMSGTAKLGGGVSGKSEKLVRTDFVILGVIVVLYGIIAYTNLGSLKDPQTFYKPSGANQEITIDLGSTQTIDTVTYYLGISDVSNKPGMKLSVSTDGKNWTDTNVSLKFSSVFKWEVAELSSPTQARYIKGTTESADYRLFEVAFWDADGNLIPAVSASGEDGAENIIDEPDTAQYRSSYMNGTYFDEIYHPRTAYENLHFMPYYETTHPPLGKLIIAVGIAIFGMTPFGWRCMGATFGIIMLPLMYILLKKLFGRTRYSVLGTLIFAFDFMHFSLTRLGTIDSYPVTFIIAMYLFMFLFGKRAVDYAKNAPQNLVGGKTLRNLFITLGLSGLMFGLGAASKWICLYAGAGLAVELLLILIDVYLCLPKKHKKKFIGFVIKTCMWCLLFFVAIPGGIYVLSYLPISMVDGYPDVWHTMLNNQTYMYNYHSNLQATHPYSSYWYQWPIDYRPLWAYSAPVETVGQDKIGCISIFGNPLIFWSSIAAFVYTIVVGIIKRERKVLFLTVGLLAQFLPWVFVTRCVFIYHFFASTPFLIVMIVYTLKDLEERFGWFRHISNAFVALCGLLFVAFYPVLSGMTITKDYSNIWLKWFSTWVFHNRGN